MVCCTSVYIKIWGKKRGWTKECVGFLGVFFFPWRLCWELSWNIGKQCQKIAMWCQTILNSCGVLWYQRHPSWHCAVLWNLPCVMTKIYIRWPSELFLSVVSFNACGELPDGFVVEEISLLFWRVVLSKKLVSSYWLVLIYQEFVCEGKIVFKLNVFWRRQPLKICWLWYLDAYVPALLHNIFLSSKEPRVLAHMLNIVFRVLSFESWYFVMYDICNCCQLIAAFIWVEVCYLESVHA